MYACNTRKLRIRARFSLRRTALCIDDRSFLNRRHFPSLCPVHRFVIVSPAANRSWSSIATQAPHRSFSTVRPPWRTRGRGHCDNCTVVARRMEGCTRESHCPLATDVSSRLSCATPVHRCKFRRSRLFGSANRRQRPSPGEITTIARVTRLRRNLVRMRETSLRELSRSSRREHFARLCESAHQAL